MLATGLEGETSAKKKERGRGGTASRIIYRVKSCFSREEAEVYSLRRGARRRRKGVRVWGLQKVRFERKKGLTGGVNEKERRGNRLSEPNLRGKRMQISGRVGYF